MLRSSSRRYKTHKRHVKKMSVSAFHINGEPDRHSGARFIKTSHGQVVFVGEYYNTLRSYYGYFSDLPLGTIGAAVLVCVCECASIHDMSVVNLPHIRDAHQWQGGSGRYTDTDRMLQLCPRRRVCLNMHFLLFRWRPLYSPNLCHNKPGSDTIQARTPSRPDNTILHTGDTM